MATKTLTYEHLLLDTPAPGVSRITLNRPDCLNAFNDAMSYELQKALKQVEKDLSTRAIILTGAGRGFCAGQDLQSRSIAASEGALPHLGESILTRYAPIILSLRTIEKPVIAMVNGVAAGAGASIAFACDFRIVSEKASFIQAFVKVGLIPDSGSGWLLPRLIGYGRALELAMTGDKVDAQKALEYGLINRIFPEEHLDSETLAFAAALASGPTKALGLMKRAFNQAETMDLATYLGYEAQLQEIAGRTEDYREGVSAFTEKRPPKFTGQ